MKSRMIVFAVLGSLFATLARAQAQNWTLTSAPSTNWSCVASSADGSKLVAAVNGGLIYTSTNSGASWGAASAPATNWSSVASSADGTKLVAESRFALFTSSDSGANWTVAATNGGIGAYGPPVLSSADGTTLTTWGGWNGTFNFFISTNSGTAWALVEFGGPVSVQLAAIACTASGRRLAIAEFGEGITGIDFFTDTGTNLAPGGYMGNLVLGQFTVVAFSADGSRVSALGANPSGADCPGQFWYSHDSGVTWMSNCMPASTWASLACSADGTKLAAVATGDAIYTSTNSGLTWRPAAVPTGDLTSIACSADGAKLVAAVAEGGIYTWQTTPALTLGATPSGGTLVISPAQQNLWVDSGSGSRPNV